MNRRTTATQAEVDAFKPGVYRHWKGPLYRALFLSQDSNNGPSGASSQEPEVIYVSLNEGTRQGQVNNRWLWQWCEIVPAVDDWKERTHVPRFEWIRD
jgi:hypothetical protein